MNGALQASPLTRDHYTEKLIGLLFAAGALAFPPAFYAILFIVIGQAHFVSAYLYQYKAGKIGGRYLLTYAVVLALFFYAALTLRNPRLITAIASVVFVVHFWIDERRLLQDEPHPLLALESTPFMLMYFACLFSNLHYIDLRKAAAIAGAAGILLHAGVLIALKERFTSRNTYFLVLNLGILAVCASGTYVATEYLIGFIILMHYSNWYVNSYFRFSSDPVRVRTYLRNMFVILGVVSGIFLLYRFGGPSFSFLKYGFSRYCFYIWSTQHILFTTRLKDLGFWRLPGRMFYRQQAG